MVCRHFVPPSGRGNGGGGTYWRACSAMQELLQSVCVTFFKPTYRYSHTKTNTQIIAQSIRSMSCTTRSEINKPINVKWSAPRAAKHTHCHRTPPLVGRSVYLDFKGVGRCIIQSAYMRSGAVNLRRSSQDTDKMTLCELPVIYDPKTDRQVVMKSSCVNDWPVADQPVAVARIARSRHQLAMHLAFNRRKFKLFHLTTCCCGWVLTYLIQSLA